MSVCRKIYKVHNFSELFVLGERQNHNRFVPGTGNHGFLTMRFDLVENFGKMFGRTIMGKSFHRVIFAIGVRIVFKLLSSGHKHKDRFKQEEKEVFPKRSFLLLDFEFLS